MIFFRGYFFLVWQDGLRNRRGFVIFMFRDVFVLSKFHKVADRLRKIFWLLVLVWFDCYIIATGGNFRDIWLRSVVVEIVLFDEWIVCLGLCCLLWVFVGYFVNFLCFVSICFWVVYKILSFFFIFFCFSVWWFGNKPATLHSQTTKEGSGKKKKSWGMELERVVY